MKYRKKPIVVEASRWWRNGDHDHVGRYAVRFDERICNYCDQPMGVHGWINTLEGSHIVCPGDWIITGVVNEYYPCKDHIFQATYEPLSENAKEVP